MRLKAYSSYRLELAVCLDMMEAKFCVSALESSGIRGEFERFRDAVMDKIYPESYPYDIQEFVFIAPEMCLPSEDMTFSVDVEVPVEKIARMA